MYKYSLVLLAATAVLFNGCGNGGCCQNVVAPTAVIESGALAAGTLSGEGSRDNNDDGRIDSYQWTVNGVAVDATYTLPVGTHEVCLTVTDNDKLTDKTCESVTINADVNRKPVATVNAPLTCSPGSDVAITGSGTDPDSNGSIAFYNWTPDTITSQTGEITCPSSGSAQVCLTVIDNKGLASTSDCKTIVVASSKPIVILSASGTVSGGFNITCETVRDQDSIDTDGVSNTYGTDNAIKEIYWQVLYGDGTQTDWNQTAFNIQEPSPYDVGYCGKWIYGNRAGADITAIKVTPVDDEDDNETYTYELVEGTGAFTLKQ